MRRLRGVQRARYGGRVTLVYLDGSTAPPVMDRQVDILALLGDRSTLARQPAFRIEQACSAGELASYRRLRRDIFVHEQGLFSRHDLDDHDDDPRTVVLVAKDRTGTVVGGVRLGPVADGPDIGWWAGGRLVVAPGARGPHGIGTALVRAACARAETDGALRLDATLQIRNEVLFERLGWRSVRDVSVALAVRANRAPGDGHQSHARAASGVASRTSGPRLRAGAGRRGFGRGGAGRPRRHRFRR